LQKGNKFFNQPKLKFMNLTLATMHRLLMKRKANSFALVKPVLTLLLLFVTTISTFAQTAKTVTGKITNDTGAGLAGVSVNVKNTTKGVITDANGNFSIDVPEGTVLVISSVGYEGSEIKVGKNATYNLTLKASSQSLDQVVVVGYGTQKRTTLTGAVASVSSKTLNELPVASIDQALQGRVAGLSVVNNGSPGSTPIIAIRGISSINGSAEPLYVIDGFPTGSLNTFDNKDVESVEVLKDASAAAIYGSRATNGVILITTKKGRRSGRLQVNLESFVGFQSPAKKIDLLNTNQYVQYATNLLGAGSLPPRLQTANFNKPIYPGAAQTFAQTNTDWQDEYFKKNAIITQHNVSVGGGNAVSRFFASAGYFNQDGIAQGLGYKRGNFRINSEHIISKYFTFGENLYTAVADQQYEGTGGNRSPLANVIRMQPYLPVYNPTNQLGGFMGPISSFDGSDPTNPVEPALLHEYHSKQLKILGSAFVEVNFTKWLKFRSTFGLDYSNDAASQYRPIYNDGGTLAFSTSSIGQNRNLYTTLLYTQQLSFNKTYGKHTIGATAVFETQGQRYANEFASGNQSNNTVKTLNGASNLNTGGRKEENFIESYVGRVTYDFENKYLLSASVRRDGLSIWAPGNKFGTFPSASIGWRIDQESFLQNVKEISELKLRAGYGITGLNGSNTLGNYPWQVVVRENAAEYAFGAGASTGQASFYDRLGNKDLSWETTKQLNLGLDLGLFKNKFTLVAEYFKRETDNLILGVPLSPSQGFNGGGVIANVGGMRNTGFEFQAAYHKTKGQLKYDVTGLISVIKNRVLNLNTESGSIGAGGDADFGGADITLTKAGEAVQSFYGWVTDGLFQNAAQVASAAAQPGAGVGDIRFKDLNGDGIITDADRTFLGSYLPKFTYSLNLSASYKSFDVSLFFQGNQGNKIYNGGRVLTEGMIRLFNAGTEVLNAWTPANPNTKTPRTINSDPNKNARVSDRWIEDGSYLRLKNLMIGYALPEATLNALTKGAVTRFRVYVSSQNLLTITKYKGWDPEIGTRRGTLTNGIDYGQYPSARSFQIGLQVGF
jgi:TonB-dependent starch-binding outer membrane protein SusC